MPNAQKRYMNAVKGGLGRELMVFLGVSAVHISPAGQPISDPPPITGSLGRALLVQARALEALPKPIGTKACHLRSFYVPPKAQSRHM